MVPLTEKLYPSHFETSALQKLILFAGSAAVGLSDPWRSDMVAVNGEVFGTSALTYMYSRMKANPEGRLVLKERPRISTKTVDYQALANLPENTLGTSPYQHLFLATVVNPGFSDTFMVAGVLFPLQYKSCCIRRHARLFSKNVWITRHAIPFTQRPG